MKKISSKLIQEIKDFYNPIINEKAIYFVVNGKNRYIRFTDDAYFLFFGKEKPAIPKENLKGVEIEGALKLTGKEIYLNLDMEVYNANVPDERTVKYMKAVRDNIGLIGVTYTDEGCIVKKADETIRNVWINSYEVSEISMKKMDNEYIAEYAERGGIDTYTSTALHFNRKPTAQDIRTAELIQQIELYLYMHPTDVYFNCWECGRWTHWLDGEGKTMAEKWSNFHNDQECGHC